MAIHFNRSKLKLSLIAAALSVCGASAFASDQVNVEKVFVRFGARPGAAEKNLIESLGGSVEHMYRHVPALAASLPATAIATLQARGYVIEPIGEVFALDTELDNSWGVKRIGAVRRLVGGAAMRVHRKQFRAFAERARQCAAQHRFVRSRVGCRHKALIDQQECYALPIDGQGRKRFVRRLRRASA